MTEVYEWVRNITCYLIFMTVITNILPNKKYEKYIRLFAGMVLILIVLKPLTSGLRLDDQIAYFFESITFQSQAEDFKKELAGMEEQRLSAMVGQYEEAVRTDVERMAAGEGLFARRVEATIESDRSSGRFGTVTGIVVVLGNEEPGENYDRAMKGMEPVEPVEPIKPVRIGNGGENGAGGADQGESRPGGADQGESGLGGTDRVGTGQEAPQVSEQAVAAAENAAVREFRRKLAEYYNLEAQDVEIQLEDG